MGTCFTKTTHISGGQSDLKTRSTPTTSTLTHHIHGTNRLPSYNRFVSRRQNHWTELKQNTTELQPIYSSDYVTNNDRHQSCSSGYYDILHLINI